MAKTSKKERKEKIIGFDPASPNGDFGCMVEGYKAMDGTIYITNISFHDHLRNVKNMNQKLLKIWEKLNSKKKP